MTFSVDLLLDPLFEEEEDALNVGKSGIGIVVVIHQPMVIVVAFCRQIG